MNADHARRDRAALISRVTRPRFRVFLERIGDSRARWLDLNGDAFITEHPSLTLAREQARAILPTLRRRKTSAPLTGAHIPLDLDASYQGPPQVRLVRRT